MKKTNLPSKRLAARAMAASKPIDRSNASQSQRLIVKTELLRRVPVTFPTIFKWMKNGDFPRSRNLGGKAGWIESEVDDWINARPNNPISDEKQTKAGEA